MRQIGVFGGGGGGGGGLKKSLFLRHVADHTENREPAHRRHPDEENLP